MRILKITLIALLVVVGALFCLTTASRYITGAHIPPTIQCDSDLIEVSVADGEEVLLSGVTARDQQDGDLTDKVLIQGVSQLVTIDTASVSYIVFDSHGNAATTSRMVRYIDYRRPQFQINEALVYYQDQDIPLLDRISAIDVADGDLTGSIRVSTLSATADPEIQNVTVQVTNSKGDTARLTLPLVIYGGSDARPRINLKEYLVYLEQGDTFSAKEYVTSVRYSTRFLKLEDVDISGEVDTSVPGVYYVTFRYPYNNTMSLSVLTVVVE